MRCSECNSSDGEFFLFCMWKCWACGCYTSSLDNNTMREYYKQKSEYPETGICFPLLKECPHDNIKG